MNSFTFLIVCFSWLFLVLGTQQSQNSQILLQLWKQLEYPEPLEPWNNYNGSLCKLISSSQITVKCEGNFITELKIFGEKPSKVTNFNGFAIPNLTLSGSFSIDSFVTTLTKLSNLRVLSLVSLGIWGSLPDKIHRLYMLEFLDLSSNFLYGSIPPKIASMVKLQTLTLDENFLNNTIPHWFDSLSNLTVLSLKNNQLKGLFPSSICRIKTLMKIALSHNEISGKLPDCLSDLTNLHVLDLGENQIDSELPVMPRQLITVLLGNNSLSGEIPSQFGELSQLQHLDLSFNFLQGTLHASLFSLRFLNYLNLASNMLTGSLPGRLTCSRALEFVDISTNRLTGKLPSCLSSMKDKRVVKFDMNCLSTDPLHQHEGSFCKENHMKGRKSVWVLIGVIGFLIVMGLLAFGFLILFRRYCSRRPSRHRRLPKAVQDYSSTGFSSEILANARFISQAAMLGSQGVPLFRIFYIEELKEATNNFDPSALMGNGSIGKLYKGKLENGTTVAIRCLALLKRYSIRNLKLRLDLFSKLRHPHLVCLLGYCIESDERDDSSVKRFFVIYEYMPNGNLHTHVSDCSPEKALKWSERLSVLIGIAKAVHFLHTGMNPGFFNNYLKTKSILLDEHGIAKLSDYGLSVITEEIDKSKAKRENSSNSYSTVKDDVYSFGFILLETLLGSATTERGEAVLVNEMATFDSRNGRRQTIDPTVLATCCEESLSIVISITNKCISRDLSTRPSFEDVLWNLQYAAQVQDDDDQT